MPQVEAYTRHNKGDSDITFLLTAHWHITIITKYGADIKGWEELA
jgi:hypothetical protein